MEKEGKEKGKKECEKGMWKGTNNSPKKLDAAKNWWFGVISSEMILLKRNVIKKYFWHLWAQQQPNTKIEIIF